MIIIEWVSWVDVGYYERWCEKCVANHGSLEGSPDTGENFPFIFGLPECNRDIVSSVGIVSYPGGVIRCIVTTRVGSGHIGGDMA